MKVSIIIPNWNGMKWLPNCMEAVHGQTFTDFEVIVIDNASEDASVSWIERNYPDVVLLKLTRNNGFAGAVNVGIDHARYDYIMLLNTDTELEIGCLERLAVAMEETESDVGAVSPLMLAMSDRSRIDDAGDELSWYGEASKGGHGKPFSDYDLPAEIFSPSGGASLYRRSFFDKVGKFDERFFAYLEDVDLGFRGRILGFRYFLARDAIVYHEGHGSEMKHALYIELVTKNRILLFLKNVPLGLLLKHGGKLLYGQIYYLLAYGHLLPSLKGYLGALRSLPSILQSRKAIQSKRVLQKYEIESLLGSAVPAEGIMFHLRKIWE